jgi:hypothetical protein
VWVPAGVPREGSWHVVCLDGDVPAEFAQGHGGSCNPYQPHIKQVR